MSKDDIAFSAVIAAFLFGGCAAFALAVPQHAEDQAAVQASTAIAPAAALEIRYIEPITVVAYRERPAQRRSHVATNDADKRKP